MRERVTPRTFCITHASNYVSGQVVCWKLNLFFMIIYITYCNTYHYFKIIKQWQTGCRAWLSFSVYLWPAMKVIRKLNLHNVTLSHISSNGENTGFWVNGDCCLLAACLRLSLFICIMGPVRQTITTFWFEYKLCE